MTTISETVQFPVVGGVDTHAGVHAAAVVDQTGRIIGGGQFPATAAGYRRLLDWMSDYGTVERVGVEGTGSYGAGLSRYLASENITVVEVNRPNRQDRRSRGKSDSVDAEAAARAALSGQAIGEPKAGDGRVEALRGLKVVRRSALKARTQAVNQIKALVVTAPPSLHDRLRPLSTGDTIATCANFKPATRSATRSGQPSMGCGHWPAVTSVSAMRSTIWMRR